MPPTKAETETVTETDSPTVAWAETVTGTVTAAVFEALAVAGISARAGDRERIRAYFRVLLCAHSRLRDRHFRQKYPTTVPATTKGRAIALTSSRLTKPMMR